LIVIKYFNNIDKNDFGVKKSTFYELVKVNMREKTVVSMTSRPASQLKIYARD